MAELEAANEFFASAPPLRDQEAITAVVDDFLRPRLLLAATGTTAITSELRLDCACPLLPCLPASLPLHRSVSEQAQFHRSGFMHPKPHFALVCTIPRANLVSPCAPDFQEYGSSDREVL